MKFLNEYLKMPTEMEREMNLGLGHKMNYVKTQIVDGEQEILYTKMVETAFCQK